MKTTNYEISRKLWEIGFKANFEYAWHDENNLSRGQQVFAPQDYGTKEGLEEIIINNYCWFGYINNLLLDIICKNC